jgi:formyl-CoA transferase
MALHARTRTGRGQVVDSAIYEAVLAMMESLITEYQQAGYIRERTGPILPGIAPSNVYPTADGLMILIAANQDTVFRRLAVVMGQEELGRDPRYATHVARGERQAELDALISAWSATIPAAELEAMLEAGGVPAGRIYRAPDIIADPQVQARNAIIRVMHHEYGELAMQNVVPRLSDTPGAVRHAAPALGADTEAVLNELLGIDAAGQAQLRARNVI